MTRNLRLEASKARAAWVTNGGLAEVRKKLLSFKHALGKIATAKTLRTKKKHLEWISAELTKIDPVADETRLQLRTACLRLGVVGGLQSAPLPTDPAILAKVVESALVEFTVHHAKPRTKVSGHAVHVAITSAGGTDKESVPRNAWKSAVGGDPKIGKRGESVSSDAVERNATRLKGAAIVWDGPVGIVAGTVRFSKTKTKK